MRLVPAGRHRHRHGGMPGAKLHFILVCGSLDEGLARRPRSGCGINIMSLLRRASSPTILVDVLVSGLDVILRGWRAVAAHSGSSFVVGMLYSGMHIRSETRVSTAADDLLLQEFLLCVFGTARAGRTHDLGVVDSTKIAQCLLCSLIPTSLLYCSVFAFSNARVLLHLTA